MKKALVLGATGRTGSLVIEELSKYKSIQVIAGLRREEDKERLPKLNSAIETAVVDIEDVCSLRKALIDSDIIIQAIRLRGDIEENALIQLDQRIHQALNPSKKVHLVTVGGAGSLKLAANQRFWEDEHFPKQTLPRGRAHAKLRDYLEGSVFNHTWTYLLPPPVYLAEGAKTGSYKLYHSAQIEAFFLSKSISYADFALAIVDAAMQDWQGVYLIAGAN
ncbi:NAD(P)-dependent oxidoreductase [Streptococcus macacae]|uniref:Saccharopine dehydrogenase domain protein n=1 Tax=Streptococcus macacae NCTC 11558 TaxID=764298 RepID=G5JYV9_9STRE|nr:NAD(P)H-binding protein [Streptococcus macacae]EHJ51813.1 saccharopine dehydrogenase domain protein [Streptococcus macacae NCTC 11558]SUN78216.1 NADH-flavin reductase [Streptococcus macacae NCTC 11558]